MELSQIIQSVADFAGVSPSVVTTVGGLLALFAFSGAGSESAFISDEEYIQAASWNPASVNYSGD